MNRFEQLILRILEENSNEMKKVSLNSQFQNTLIKQRALGSLSEAFNDSIQNLINKKFIIENRNIIKLVK